MRIAILLSVFALSGCAVTTAAEAESNCRASNHCSSTLGSAYGPQQQRVIAPEFDRFKKRR